MGEGFRDTPEGGGRGRPNQPEEVVGSQLGHLPVLLKEAIDFLSVRRGGTYIDATVGLGGHSLEIAKRLGRPGRLIGFDKDPQALVRASESLRIQPRREEGGDWPTIELIQGSFRQAGERILPGSADGILADLGVSSLQFADPARGFSFQAEGPLDMRMDPQSEPTAEQVVNRFDERELAELIYKFGEERRSRRIARAIVRSRPMRTTVELAAVVSAAARPMKRERIHPATRTFQALRIFVNRELEELEKLLEVAPRLLRSGGRLVVISFHSLEDRRVKDAMRAEVREGRYRLLTKKPVTAGREELDRNPRSRSAKLRAAEKI